MSAEGIDLRILAERPCLRGDQASEIDIAVALSTSTPVGDVTGNYAVNLCVIIDRSGSMAGDKLEQAKRSCVDIYNNLNANDQMTVLAFDTEVVIVANPQTPKAQIVERISALQDGGGTDLSKGWYLGLLEVQTYSSPTRINRIILLSDGAANAGEQKASVLAKESSRAFVEYGITTSTIGIGDDFQEDILSAIARESGGRFWFIGAASIEEIVKEEFGGALSVIAERPSFSLILPSNIHVSKELHALPKVGGLYRTRPIKANDHVSFAFRLSHDPQSDGSQPIALTVEMYNGTQQITQASLQLPIVSFDDFLKSTEDPMVATIVAKHVSATSDEQIASEIDKGDVTQMIDILKAQSELMKGLESKLAGSRAMSWEESEEIEANRVQHELAELQGSILENDALAAVAELVQLLGGLGQSGRATNILGVLRKVGMNRSVRKGYMSSRGRDAMDDWGVRHLLVEAEKIAEAAAVDNPSYRVEFASIRESINEQLARLS